MGSLFVAGTESGVGKTVVVAALARIAAESGALPVVYKPFITDDMEDLRIMMAAIWSATKKVNGRTTVAPLHCLAGYQFDSPASPYTSMIGEGVDVGDVMDGLAKLRRGVRHEVEEAATSMGAEGTLQDTPRGEVVVVEGYGGAMTPIRSDYFMADLIKDLEIPAVIVTTNRIGALGLSAMTALSCRERGVEPAGFVVNGIDPDGYDPAVLAEDIMDVTGTQVLAVLGAYGAPAPPKRKGSMFGSLPVHTNEKMRIEDTPEDVKRSVAAAEGVHGSGALDGIARSLIGGTGWPAGPAGQGRKGGEKGGGGQ